MKELAKRDWFPPAAAAALGGILAALLCLIGHTDLIALPARLGGWLRALSLSGGGGNAVAWAVVAAISLLPALGLLWRGRRRADWLLLLTAVILFAGLYFLVNPGLLCLPVHDGSLSFRIDAASMAQMWGLGVVSCVEGTLAAWALLRLLSATEHAPARLLPRVLHWAALLYALFVGFAAVSGVVGDISAVAAGNTDLSRVTGSSILLIVVALLALIPQIMGAVIILWGSTLTHALNADPFAEETVALAETITRRCVRVACLSLLLSVVGNVLQLLCVPVAASVTFHVQLPILTLALCAALFLLCRYFRQAKAVSDDNASII